MIITCSRAEGDGEVSLLAGWAGPESSAARLVVSIDVAVGAVALEVVVVGNTGLGARRGGVVATTAAAGRVAGVGIDKAITLTAKREASRVEWTLELSRAVRAEIDRAVSNVAADVVADAHGKIVTIDEGDVVVVLAVTGSQGELSESGGGNTSSGAGVTFQTTVAATIGTRVGSRVGAEVAVPASPNAASLPVLRNGERPHAPCGGFPTSLNVWNSGSNVQVSEDGGPNGEWAGIVDREGTSRSGGSEGKGSKSGTLHC
jgi:hypothetical protein